MEKWVKDDWGLAEFEKVAGKVEKREEKEAEKEAKEKIKNLRTRRLGACSQCLNTNHRTYCQIIGACRRRMLDAMAADERALSSVADTGKEFYDPGNEFNCEESAEAEGKIGFSALNIYNRRNILSREYLAFFEDELGEYVLEPLDRPMLRFTPNLVLRLACSVPHASTRN